MTKKYLLGVCTILLLGANNPTAGCTRAVYQGEGGVVMTGRSMDWVDDLQTDLWIFPRGIERSGMTNLNPLIWTSKYGSVIASAYNFSSSDGVNEKGLSANLLWLAESDYGTRDERKPGLSVAAWVQYVLDNFATVSEAVEGFRQERFQLVTDLMPGTNFKANVHLSISDASGDNAIIEYIGGELKIYHNRIYQVLTNSPSFDQQWAIAQYWKGLGGTTMLPGTNRAPDRFARASFYINAIPRTDDTQLAVVATLSVIRNCSVPLGISTPDQPNISSTQWRTVVDHKNRLYFYESAHALNTFWVDLTKIDFSPSGSVKKLNLPNTTHPVGDATLNFIPATPFVFLGV